MINVHCPVNSGFIVSPDGQYEISGLIVRGGTNVAVMGTSKQSGEELPGGMEVDLSSFIQLCKRVLIETGTLPKWFYIGVIVDANHSQIITYFNPIKEKFFSDIYQYIMENLPSDLTVTDTETVVKNFFERNRDFHFSYEMIPLDSLFTGSSGGKAELTNIRF